MIMSCNKSVKSVVQSVANKAQIELFGVKITIIFNFSLQFEN